jgi:hypothetical protein
LKQIRVNLTLSQAELDHLMVMTNDFGVLNHTTMAKIAFTYGMKALDMVQDPQMADILRSQSERIRYEEKPLGRKKTG